MIENLWLIGIGTGSTQHVTLEGREAIRAARVILIPNKGDGKESLARLRHQIIDAAGFTGDLVTFEYPVRDEDLPYVERVERWHDEIARRWQSAVEADRHSGPVALLVWGDPALYDSTMRIAERLNPKPRLRLVPGITAIQALTAACQIPLNTLAGSVHITTGRRLRKDGWPSGAETVVVMLDGETSFTGLAARDLHIWWGAYLGSEDEITLQGPLSDIQDEIVQRRAEARARHGWIMDTYLLRAPKDRG